MDGEEIEERERERKIVGIENVLRGLVGEKSRFNPNSPEKSCDST